MTEEKVIFKDSKGNKLSGILSDSNSKVKIVILCHGLNSKKDSSTNLALVKAFSRHGIATFRFDFFAHGESEGKVEDRTVEKFVDGLLKAVDYVKGQGYSKIGVCGASFGGMTAVIAATKTPDIKAIALKAAGMGQTSRKMPNYKEDFDTKIWIKAGEKVKIPTLIVHGTEDEDVEIQLGEELAKSIKASKFIKFEGADHRFTNPEDFEKSVKLISDFISNNL